MPLDADVQAMLDALAAAGAPSFGALGPEAARAAYAAAPKPAPEPIHATEDLTLPGPAGPLAVRVYRPSADRDLPVVAFFHGGGWVLSSVEGQESLDRRLANLTGALVASVEYRLAPETPYPGAFEDCWAATAWLAEHAGEIGGDPSRLAVAGDSAGGNLAAAVALRARDEGVPLAFQLLVYPVLDADFDRPSYVDNAEGYFLTAKDMRWFWDQYVPDPADRANPFAAPLRAPDLRGVAPALVVTAEFDPLRDEGRAYGDRLAEAGVPVTVSEYPGVVHGFVSRWQQIARAHAAHEEAARALSAALRRRT